MNVSLRRSLAVAALTLAPVLASCGFGQPTDQVYNPGEGTNARDGRVDVLGALVVSAEDGSGTVVAGLANNDEQEPDVLTEIGGPEVTASGLDPIDVPAGGFVQLADAEIALEGDSIAPGNFVEVTFAFENAEAVTLDVPVVPNTGDYADVPVPLETSPSPASPSPEETESPAPEETESPAGG